MGSGHQPNTHYPMSKSQPTNHTQQVTQSKRLEVYVLYSYDDRVYKPIAAALSITNSSYEAFRPHKKLVKTKRNNVGNIIRNYTNVNEIWLWTGESVYCKCTHHVEQHCTHCYQRITIFHCHSCNECTGFEAYKIRANTSVETEPLRLNHKELVN